MASEKRPASFSSDDPSSNGASGDVDSWIFEPEPETFATEELPDREDFERLRAEKAQLEGEPQRLFAPLNADGEESEQAAAAPLDETSDVVPPAGSRPAALPDEEGADGFDLVRSGDTPTVAPRRSGTILPPRFRDLSGWDALRDLLVVLCFGSAFATALTDPRTESVPMLWPRIAAGIGLLALVAVYVLRWGPTYREGYDPKQPPNLKLIGVVRLVGMLPAFAVSIGVMLYDFVLSIPDLITPLPDGPRVGIGAGVALLLVGAVVGSERRGFEGYVPDAAAKARAETKLRVLRYAAFASFALAFVMMVGKAINGDLLFSLMTLGRSLGALALVVLIVRPKLNRASAWYVFITGAAGAMVVGGAADNTLRLDYAAPASFSNAYVWLPFVFAAFGVLVSRAYVRSSNLRFERVDWIVYAARAFEFSIVLHAVAIVIAVIQAVAIFFGYEGNIGVTLALVTIVFLAVLLGLSFLGRRALGYVDATKARSHAVSACVALAIVGFVGILVYSIASGAAAGLMNGGLALVVGIVAALMLTVPSPVVDEFGAPDLDRTFAQFRARESRVPSVLPFLPDISKATSERKSFPS